MWKGERKRSASSQMYKQEKKDKAPSSLCIYIFCYGFFSLCVFLSFLLVEKKKMPRRKCLKQKGRYRMLKAKVKSEKVE